MNEEHPLRDLICPVCGRAILNHYYMVRSKQNTPNDALSTKIKKYKTYKDPDSIVSYYDYLSKIYDMHRNYIAVEGQGGRAGLSMMRQIPKEEWQHGFDLIQYAVARAIKWWINMDWTSCETICDIIDNFDKIQTPIDNPAYITNLGYTQPANYGNAEPPKNKKEPTEEKVNTKKPKDVEKDLIINKIHELTGKKIPDNASDLKIMKYLISEFESSIEKDKESQRTIYQQEFINTKLYDKIESMQEASTEEKHKKPVSHKETPINYKLLRKIKKDRLTKEAAIITADEDAGIFAPVSELHEMYSDEKVAMILKARKMFPKISESPENVKIASEVGAIDGGTVAKLLDELKYRKEKQGYKYEYRNDENNKTTKTTGKTFNNSKTQEIPLVSFLLPKTNLEKLYPDQPKMVNSMLKLHELFDSIASSESDIKIALKMGMIPKNIAKLFRLALKQRAALRTVSFEVEREPKMVKKVEHETSVEEFKRLHPDLVNEDENNDDII